MDRSEEEARLRAELADRARWALRASEAAAAIERMVAGRALPPTSDRDLVIAEGRRAACLWLTELEAAPGLTPSTAVLVAAHRQALVSKADDYDLKAAAMMWRTFAKVATPWPGNGE